jgi:hypothetical protein
MKIKRFLDFINESYLSGSRQPLYHYTNHIFAILDTDCLKMGTVVRPKKVRAICLTRNPYFTHDGSCTNSTRIVLDSDKLRLAGYISLPVDEVGLAASHYGQGDKNFIKSNIENIKSGKRTVHNNVGLKKPGTSGLEVEYEERIYRDIEDLGLYIISIDIAKESDIPRNIYPYLEKYPNIIINLYDVNKRTQVKDITDVINKKKSISV